MKGGCKQYFGQRLQHFGPYPIITTTLLFLESLGRRGVATAQYYWATRAHSPRHGLSIGLGGGAR